METHSSIPACKKCIGRGAFCGLLSKRSKELDKTEWLSTRHTTLRAESEEELMSFLMRVKEESEKADLKLNIQRNKILASNPITSWQIEGEKVETVTYFIFLGSKITMGDDCSHEIKTLAPWKKSYDKSRQCIKKQRRYFADKGPNSQSYGFSSSHVWV